MAKGNYIILYTWRIIMKKKNVIMAIVAKEDPARFRSRTVEPEKGKGKKSRPRVKKIDSSGDLPFVLV